MAAISERVWDHRRRILDHQEKTNKAEQNAAITSPDRQLKMPLIGEVRRPPEPAPKPARSQRKRSMQPKLTDTL